MNTIVVDILLPLITASLLAFWVGWGIARLLLPPALQPWRTLLAPLMGYALTIVTGYWVVRFLGGLGLALGILLPFGGLCNVLAWRRYGPPRISAALRQHWPVLLVAGVGIVVGIAPLLSYGYSAPIGEGWDIENYWPTARYLSRGPVSAIAAAPSNPLRDLNVSPPRIGLTLGFSIWQGSVDLLGGSEPLTSFAPLLAWLRALGGVGIYVLLRVVFNFRRWSATIAALLTVLNGLLLWVSFFNFGMQLAAWPLIPLAIIVGLAAVQASRFGEGLVAAAIGLAALPITYYPALGPVGLMAAGIGIVTLWQTQDRWRMIRQAVTLLLLTLLLALPTIPDYFAGFNYRYSLPLTTLGLFRFVPLSDMVGLTPFRLRAAPEPLNPLAGVAALMMIGLAGYAILAAPQRNRWVGMLLGATGFLIYLRCGTGYHYGYLKAAAYLGWIAGALAVAGLQALIDRWAGRWGWLRPISLLGITLCLGGSITLTAGRVVADHWERPGLFADTLPALRDLRQVVPAGSSVFLSGDPRVQGVTSALAAYLLDHTAVYGAVRTGYATSVAANTTGIGDYVLLHRDEDPTAWGIVSSPVWRSDTYALYRKPESVIAHLPLDQLLRVDQAMTLSVSDRRLGLNEIPSTGEPDERWLTLQVAALAESGLSIDGRTYRVPAGRSWLTVGPLLSSRAVAVRQHGAEPILLQSALLTTDPPVVRGRLPHNVVLQATSTADDLRITTSLAMFNPDSGPVVAAIEVWDRRQGYFFGRYGLRVPVAATIQQQTITLDLRDGKAIAVNEAGEPLPLGVQQGVRQPGAYTARLWLGTDQRALLTPVDLFAFTIDQAGNVTLDWVAQHPLLTTAMNRPVHPLNIRFGNDMLLRGYDLSAGRVTAGESIAITLWWEALRGNLDERSIMLHLRNDRDERIVDVDGPPAAGGRPTSLWQAGEVVIDDRRLTIPADLPPGRYWLVIGSYRWPSLEPLPVAGTDTTVWRIPIEVVAPAMIAAH